MQHLPPQNGLTLWAKATITYMQANPFIIAIVLALVGLVVFFIIRQNNKDRRRFEQQQNKDYPRPKDDGPKT